MAAVPSAFLVDRVAECLSVLDAIPLLRSASDLQQKIPKCLDNDFRGLWLGDTLASVTLAQLLAADSELSACQSWLKSRAESSFRVVYISFKADVISVPGPDESSVRPECRGEQAFRGAAAWTTDEEGWDKDGPDAPGFQFEKSFCTPAQLARRCDVFQALEITSRRVSLPQDLHRQAMKEVSASCEEKDKWLLAAMGLDKLEFIDADRCPGRWGNLQFANSAPKPLMIWHLEALFDLPGGDGGVDATVGYIDASMNFHVTSRNLCEYPVNRYFRSGSSKSWKEMQEIFEKRKAPTSGTWQIHNSGMLRTDWTGRNIVDQPDLSAAYKDCKSFETDSDERRAISSAGAFHLPA